MTELGLGTAPLGELFDRIDDDEAAAIVAAAWRAASVISTRRHGTDAGLRSIRWAGALSQAARPLRHSTKIGRVLRRPLGPNAIKDQWLGGLEFQTVFSYGYDGVMRSFEDSLQRLGINRVDVLLIHDLDPWDHNPGQRSTPILTRAQDERVAGAGAELREGRSDRRDPTASTPMGSIPRFLDLFDIDFFLLAMRYTLLEQEVLENRVHRCARSAASKS